MWGQNLQRVNTLIITGSNEAGSNSDDVAIIYNKPITVVVPIVKFIDPASPVTVNTNIFPITVQTRNVKEWQDVTVNVNGINFSNFNFSTEGIVSTNIPLKEGTNRVEVTGKNQSGSVSDFATITYTKPVKVLPPAEPCPPPVLKMIEPAQNELTTEYPSFTIRTEISNIVTREQLSVTLNNSSVTNYNFNGNEIAYAASLVPGINSYIISATNNCGTQKINYSIFYKPREVIVEKPCGIRINPGNSSWEFCMVTPAGTIIRDTLTNSNFRYSGPASSLYFMPVAGGGDAVVKGKPYTLRPGQYYLFTGNMTVTISTNNPGSMGQWSVCIIADKEPLSGNGNNRPKSPCEEQGDKGKPKKSDAGKDNL